MFQIVQILKKSIYRRNQSFPLKLNETSKLIENEHVACSKRAMDKPHCHFQRVLEFHRVWIDNYDYLYMNN